MGETKMKLLEDVISEVSVFYREKLKETLSAQNELYSIANLLNEKVEEISFGEYKRLMEKKERLAEEVKLSHKYCDAIHDIRELLFDYCCQRDNDNERK